MASRIAGLGFVTVSLRRSMGFMEGLASIGCASVGRRLGLFRADDLLAGRRRRPELVAELAAERRAERRLLVAREVGGLQLQAHAIASVGVEGPDHLQGGRVHAFVLEELEAHEASLLVVL